MGEYFADAATWLKPFADQLYTWYAGCAPLPYELRVVPSSEIDGAFGRFSFLPQQPESRLIEISEEQVREAWGAELARRLSGERLLIFFDKSWHEGRCCNCHSPALCGAWVRLCDTLMHELTHLYCHVKQSEWKTHREHCAHTLKFRGHCTHFLWFAIRMRLDLRGVYFESEKTQALCDRIMRRLRPPPHVVKGKLMLAPGRVRNTWFLNKERRTEGERPEPWWHVSYELAKDRLAPVSAPEEETDACAEVEEDDYDDYEEWCFV